MCTHTHIYAYTYTCSRAYPHTHSHTHARIHVHIHTYTYIHACTHTYTHMHACMHTHHSQTKESQRPVCTPARATAQGTCRTHQGEITLARLPTAHLPSTALASRLFVHSSGVTPLKDHGSFSKALSLAKERPDSLYRTGANPRRGSISPPRHSLPVCPRKQGWVGDQHRAPQDPQTQPGPPICSPELALPSKATSQLCRRAPFPHNGPPTQGRETTEPSS